MIDPGTIVDGRYEVLGRVGSGGMADVYLASDRLLGRKVAVKILHHRFAEDQEFVERFKREASSAAGLSHPNVVSIFDRGEWDGTYYIAMEYLPGRTLKAIVRERGPLPPAAAIDVVVQVLRAARFAHRRGVIHRDLKPHNVILDEEGRAKVTDFGIARAGASDMTLTGSIMGTAQYLSPEQAQGLAVSESSDIYAIGVVLYELLTGKIPFEGETAVTIALQHISREPAPPSTLNPAVTPALDAVVLRALQKDPAQRYRSAEEAIAALERVRSTLPEPRDEHALAAAGLAAGLALPPDAAATSPTATSPTDSPPIGAEQPIDGAPPPAAARPGEAAAAGAGVAGAAAAAGAVSGLAARTQPTSVLPVPPPHPAVRIWQPTTGQLPPYDPGRGPRGPAAGGPGHRNGDGSPESQRNRRRALLWALALIPLAVAAALVLLLSPPATVSVPGLVGLPRMQARAKLHTLGLRAVESLAASSGVPAGRVVSQVPDKGQTAKPGSTVEIVVSTGPGSAAVPKVAGMTEAAALRALHAAGLSPTVQRRSSEHVKSGIAIGTEPPAGSSRRQGTEVSLIVSSGPAQVRVPGVVGESRASAEAQLEEAGLTVGAVTERQQEGATPGTVLSQTPRPGAKVANGSSVALVVAKSSAGPAIVVPSVLEDERESALATLRAAGLKPEVISQTVASPARIGYVVKQEPAAGTHVHKGATVKIYVGAETSSTTSSSSATQTTSTSTTQTTSTKSVQAGG